MNGEGSNPLLAIGSDNRLQHRPETERVDSTPQPLKRALFEKIPSDVRPFHERQTICYCHVAIPLCRHLSTSRPVDENSRPLV